MMFGDLMQAQTMGTVVDLEDGKWILIHSLPNPRGREATHNLYLAVRHEHTFPALVQLIRIPLAQDPFSTENAKKSWQAWKEQTAQEPCNVPGCGESGLCEACEAKQQKS